MPKYKIEWVFGHVFVDISVAFYQNAIKKFIINIVLFLGVLDIPWHSLAILGISVIFGNSLFSITQKLIKSDIQIIMQTNFLRLGSVLIDCFYDLRQKRTWRLSNINKLFSKHCSNLMFTKGVKVRLPWAIKWSKVIWPNNSIDDDKIAKCCKILLAE